MSCPSHDTNFKLLNIQKLPNRPPVPWKLFGDDAIWDKLFGCRENADDDEITFRSRANARPGSARKDEAKLQRAILWSILNFNPKSTIVHENNFLQLRVMFSSLGEES